MGCRAFTPPLVGLARELEGQPFHLLSSHNQSGSAEAARHEIFQNGLAPLAPNVTVAKQADHPGVKGTGYVPYYLVFDHHGDLAYHHQGGPYHGGDGNAVHDRVREMLTQVPVIYCGKEAFENHERLALELQKGHKLKKSFATLAALLKTSPEDPELLRLAGGVELYRDNLLRELRRQQATDPAGALKQLKAAVKEFEGTPWAAPLAELLTEATDRASSKAFKSAAKSLRSIEARLAKLDPVQGNAGKVLNPLDGKFREQNERSLNQIVKALKDLAAEYPDTPAGKRAAELHSLLE